MDKKVELIQSHARKLVCVDSSASLKEVYTFMLAEGVSYLPIIDNNLKKNVGVYKRKDFFKWFILNPHKNIDEVDKSEFKSDKLPEVSMESSLKETMKSLHDNSALLIKDEGRFTHLITPRVVANALEEYSERFYIYEKLEKSIRYLIVRQGIKLKELDDAKLNKPFPPEVEKLDFGQYRTIFSKKWDSLGLSYLDKDVIGEYLKNANNYRNALMHFRLTDESVGFEDAKKLLKILQSIL